MKNTIFRPGRVPTFGALILIPLFISLGMWQLRRADEKAALMALSETRATSAPVALRGDGLSLRDDRYRPVTVDGRYDADHQFLLDNQITDQRAGYAVLTPLRIAGSDRAVLVNRGWVAAGPDRMQLPDVALAAGELRVNGVLDKFPSVGLRLKGAEVPGSGWPSVVQVADWERMSERLGYRLLPYQVLLGPAEPNGYRRQWRQADLHPEKNQGYALQWFSFALVLAILYVWYGFKPKPASAPANDKNR